MVILALAGTHCPCESVDRDVDKSVDPDLAPLHDELSEALEGHRACAARINDGCHTCKTNMDEWAIVTPEVFRSTRGSTE